MKKIKKNVKQFCHARTIHCKFNQYDNSSPVDKNFVLYASECGT